MQIKEYKDGVRLSRLGMGNMRLPQQDGKIDYEKAAAIIDRAMELGVNYYDTAYIYHGGKSEEFVGRALAKYPRDSYYVADKFNIDANPDYVKQFGEQLQRLNMDRIDFYMLHGVMDFSVDKFLNNGCIQYFEKMRAQGKIRYLGFSFHGSAVGLRRLLAAHKWDFVQLQMNYYDWYNGDAKDLYEIATEAGVPVMVMEPVRGGMLAKLEGEPADMLKNASGRSLAAWAMEWVRALDNVQVVLSGMSDLAQLEDNAAVFSGENVLTDGEQAILQLAAQEHHSRVAVLCTGCRYCTDGCPMELDIPRLMSAYNEAKLGGAWRLSALSDLSEDKLPSACIACGACTGHCPQSIDIPGYMAKLAEMMARNN